MPDASTTQQALSEALDEALLSAVRAQIDSDEPNAAVLNAATARLKALGITHLVSPDSAAGQLARECGLTDPNVLKMPGLSDLDETGT